MNIYSTNSIDSSPILNLPWIKIVSNIFLFRSFHFLETMRRAWLLLLLGWLNIASGFKQSQKKQNIYNLSFFDLVCLIYFLYHQHLQRVLQKACI